MGCYFKRSCSSKRVVTFISGYNLFPSCVISGEKGVRISPHTCCIFHICESVSLSGALLFLTDFSFKVGMRRTITVSAWQPLMRADLRTHLSLFVLIDVFFHVKRGWILTAFTSPWRTGWGWIVLIYELRMFLKSQIWARCEALKQAQFPGSSLMEKQGEENSEQMINVLLLRGSL